MMGVVCFGVSVGRMTLGRFYCCSYHACVLVLCSNDYLSNAHGNAPCLLMVMLTLSVSCAHARLRVLIRMMNLSIVSVIRS